ncbi:cell division protein FtsQ/DivIB [Puniceibacterium sp. IMCC21224]|uniref:cell division protein FtsQ/DivIB n=1 Tax=Puniceibacterium sp. IMCC21224 TaxID=1618204 RepID=UPI00064DFC67|nr:cell division protein FtsQ/DivIB [Puniceibacterium sp. IMCC21224]
MTRSDPAPSRLRYRIQRLMLTPLFRVFLRVGLPFAVTFGGASLWFSMPDNRDAFLDLIIEARSAVEQRPEFMVKLMAIDGASDGVAADIRTILPVGFPVSSFGLDLDVMRDQVVALDAVESARLRIRQGGVLQVDVDERLPVVLWRGPEGLQLLDSSGVKVGPVQARTDFPALPLIVGRGASKNVPEALELLAAAEPLWSRMRGLVRVGGRRWDLVLDRDQRILLPEEDPVRALERAMALDHAVDMLDRDLLSVDLRLPQRPTLRLTNNAQQELWRIKAIEVGEP